MAGAEQERGEHDRHDEDPDGWGSAEETREEPDEQAHQQQAAVHLVNDRSVERREDAIPHPAGAVGRARG
jgi:hypothetical protein